MVSFGKDTKGKRKVVITPEVGEPKEYLISKGKHLSVHEGDRVRAGEPLMDGAANPHDILKMLGEKALAKYLVDEVQEVYRLQGVKINDKHIEVDRAADAAPHPRHRRGRHQLPRRRAGRASHLRGGERARSCTRAARRPRASRCSSASPRRRSRPSRSSRRRRSRRPPRCSPRPPSSGKVDYLRGLKENVIMGRLIPAGTGLGAYKKMTLTSTPPHEEVRAAAACSRCTPPAPSRSPSRRIVPLAKVRTA